LLKELNLKEYKQTNVLGQLIESIHLTDNIIEIFGEATKQLYQVIQCDHVNILFNNEKARYFYINQILNQPNPENGHDLIIPYNETSITEILRSHRSIIRMDLSIRGGLTPGDLKFLAEGIKSDLSVPIIHKNKILAVINLSSYQSNYFTAAHQVQTEQIASLLGLALGRIELIEKLNKKQSDLLLWKNKFKSIINNISESIAIIRLDYDLIYETNTAFEKLTGYSSEQLHGMRLSHLHSPNEEMILSKLDKNSINGKIAAIDKIFLNRKDDTQIPVSLKFVHIGGSITNFIFAIYEHIPETNPVISAINEKSDIPGELISLQLSVFSDIINSANSDLNLNDLINSALLAIKKVTNFDYAQITLFDTSGKNIENHTIISDRCREYDKQKSWNILEDCDFYWYNISEQNLKQQFEARSNSFDSTEKELRSRIPAVLMTKNRNIGTLVLGSLQPDFYQKYQVEFVNEVAGQIAILIENERLSLEQKERILNRSIQSDLTGIIGVNLNIDHVLSGIVKLSAEKMQAQLATIQLIEKDKFLPGVIVSDQNCDKVLISNFENDNIVTEILTTKEPYITSSIPLSHTNQMRNSKSGSFNYRTYLTIFLKLKEKTIGMLTNYWNKPYQINSDDLRLIGAIANQASSAIENAKLFQQSLSYCEQLEKAKTELENFIDSVSHDLTTPLASIQGFSSILLNNLKEEIGNDNLNYLQKVRDKVVKMQRYIDELNELARVGQAVHSFDNVNIAGIIEQAEKKLLDMIQQHKIKISVNKNLPNAYGDRQLLLQLFVNLIDIAIKHIGENNKRPKIEIGCRNENGDGAFFVRNNNMNTRAEFHDNIFALHHRIENQADEEKGYGLGLAIAKKIVDVHNGQIWFESEQGKGCSFYFSLPQRYHFNQEE